jgi:hypothetical protein
VKNQIERSYYMDILFLCRAFNGLRLWSQTYGIWIKFNHASLDEVAKSHALAGQAKAMELALMAVATGGFLAQPVELLQ